MQTIFSPTRITITENNTELGEMKISIKDGVLTAHHTEAFPAGEGKGVGKKLFAIMTEHVFEKGLRLRPLCTFVQAMVKRDPEKFKDVLV